MLPQQQRLLGQMRERKAAAIDRDNQISEAEIDLENHVGKTEIDQTVMTHDHHDHYTTDTRSHIISQILHSIK